jgi:Asp/Glu/hydantoin racemase
VLCSCSTIGGIAESLADEVGVPVVRGDRPMAEEAARLGARIGVVFTAPNTLGPTEELLREAAPHAALSLLPCPQAWPLFWRGDLESYVDTIAEVLRKHESMVDVFVLAQPSMAPAADRCAGIRVPILSSPALAAAELLRRVGR